jgi:hypothetical protein
MFAGQEFFIHWWPVQADISADGTPACPGRYLT